MRTILPITGIPYSVSNGRITSHAEGSLMKNAPFRWIDPPREGECARYYLAASGPNASILTERIVAIYDGVEKHQQVIDAYEAGYDWKHGDVVRYNDLRWTVEGVFPNGDVSIRYGWDTTARVHPCELVFV